MEEGIFEEIKADTILSAKISAGDGRYHIYPLHIPDGVMPSKALTYTEIDQSLTYPLVRSSTVQISCIADTLTEARGMADDINRIFNDKLEMKLGGVFAIKYMKFIGRSSLYDTDSKKYIYPVELFIKF